MHIPFSFAVYIPAQHAQTELRNGSVAIVDADRSQLSRRIVDALISLGRTLGMDVIAEGVETQEQAHKLRYLDCRIAQGFWFSKPLPAEAAYALLIREQGLSKSSIRSLHHH